jgi:enoyl-CoA hydratase/carnithine racemase
MAVGLINRAVPASQLDQAVLELTDAIVGSSPMTIQLGKRAFYDQWSLDEATAYERATCVMTENAIKHDAQEGITAFLQKRSPQWKGE